MGMYIFPLPVNLYDDVDVDIGWVDLSILPFSKPIKHT